MKKLLFALFLLIGNSALSQVIPEGYTQVGTLPANNNYNQMDVLLSPDGKYFLVSHGFKPTTLEVYSPKGFEKLREFSIKKGLLHFASFDLQNSDIFYMTGSIRKYHKLNLKTGTQELTKTRQLPERMEKYNPWVYGQHAVTEKDGTKMYLLPEMYAVKFLKDEIQIYIWNELLD